MNLIKLCLTEIEKEIKSNGNHLVHLTTFTNQCYFSYHTSADLLFISYKSAYLYLSTDIYDVCINLIQEVQ